MQSTARYLSFVLVGAVWLGACVPTAARKNARLEEGLDIDLIGGFQYVEVGENSNGTSSAPDQVLHLEVDLQYAHITEDRSGFAVQLKLPLNFIFTTLDFYYQLAETNSKWFFGFGAELGVLPGVYGVVTHYFHDQFYASFTPRLLNAESREEQQAVLINPQISVGMAGPLDFSLFASFAHHTGNGFNFDVDLFNVDDDDDDYRTNYWLTGASIRF